MARIYPFEALRYNPARVHLEDVVTQPYDKITPSLQQAYYQRSPYNLVRIILGLPELFDNATSNVYTRAAEHFNEWRKQGVLFHDNEPAVYAYSQLYAVPGEDNLLRERRGLIALGELVDYSAGVVFRHEKTLSKPKSDRLNLLRATRAHFGQIFMLYSDPVHTVEKLIFSSDAPPDIEVTDDYGVVHRLWKISEPAVINLVTTAMADKKLIIADGHHRYETALNYSRERQPDDVAPRTARGTYQAPAYPEAAVMMTFINMDSEGLTILPTHRVVRDLPNFSVEDFLNRARAYFDVSEVSPARDPLEVLRSTAASGKSIFFVATAKGGYLLISKPEKVAEALPGYSERQRKVDVAQLHGVILENLLGLSQESIANQINLSYLRDASEALDLVRNGQAQIAFLMNPATLDQLRDVAFAGETMPQKSTDFYPKLLSGLTIYALD
jgi:uncharacterized protein (DUF1015 family)